MLSGIYPVENHAGSCTSEVSPKDYRPEQVSQEFTDDVTSKEISGEHVAEGPNVQDDSDNQTKKGRVEENSSEDGNVIADCCLNERREERLDESGSLEDAVLRDHQGSAAVEATSVAERVIQPTLVMFEVTLRSQMTCILLSKSILYFYSMNVDYSSFSITSPFLGPWEVGS